MSPENDSVGRDADRPMMLCMDSIKMLGDLLPKFKEVDEDLKDLKIALGNGLLLRKPQKTVES